MLNQTFLALLRRIHMTPRRMASLLDHMPAWAIRKLSEARLVRTLRHVYLNSPAQRERWSAAGVRRSDLRSPEVLTRIPFTTGSDLLERPEDYKCVPGEKLVHVFTTSGTKERPKQIYLTRDDLEHQLQTIGTSYLLLPGPTRVLVMFSTRFPGWAAPQTLTNALRKAGVFVVLSGTEHSVREQFDLIRKHHINLIVSAPTYLHRLTLEADADPRSFGVRYIHLGSQPWTEAFRAEMTSAWGATVLDCYGSAESGFGLATECVHPNAQHVAETDFWLEVVDPATGRSLPDGEEGELVFTTLSRYGMPLVRYRTGDIAHLIERDKRCPCGTPLRRMSRVRGRWDDIFIIGVGTNVHPADIDAALLSLPGVTDYQLVLTKDSYRDVLHVTVEQEGDGSGVEEAVVKALLDLPQIRDGCEHSRTVVIDTVEVVPPGTLSAGLPKSARIIDQRLETRN